MTQPAPESARGGRTRAREVVFRALFEADISGDDPVEVLELSMGRFRFTPDGRAFALRLAEGLVEHLETIDRELGEILERWSLARVSAVTRAILRCALAEMLCAPDSPVRVILSEALRLSDRYGEEDSGGFINGVLDAAARRLRPGALDPPAPGGDRGEAR